MQVLSQFTSPKPEETLADSVGAVLGHEGWTRHDTTINFYPYSLTPTENFPVNRVEPQWSKPMQTGSALIVTLYPNDTGPTAWVLESVWDPPGFSLPGC